MKIDVKTIKELAENIGKFNLNEVALESEGVKLVLKKEKVVPTMVAQPVQQQMVVSQPMAVESVEENTEVIMEDENLEYITSPMVGTFYKSSAPGNPAFVEVGNDVTAGDTLCIVEAMKLMNEVKAQKNCKIVKILVEDGQSIKKGDKLFAIK